MKTFRVLSAIAPHPSLKLRAIGAAALAALFAVACGSSSDGDGTGDQDLTGKQDVGTSLPPKTLALTFDDGPGPRTKELSSYLRAQGIQAGFFMMGIHAQGAEDILQQVNADGHVIGNHTWDHPLLTRVSAAAPSSTGLTDTYDEIHQADAVLSPFYQGKMKMFRAPFGGWSRDLADALNQTELSGYVGSIFWDIGGELTDTHAADWACWGKKMSIQDCGDRYIQEIHDRGDHGIVLSHDIHSNTVDMMKYIVPILKSQGFRFVRVDQVPQVNAQLIALGATPMPAAGKGTTSPPATSECADDGTVCGADVKRDPGTLYSCQKHHLKSACQCAGACAAGTCDCDGGGGEPGITVTSGLFGQLALAVHGDAVTGSVHDGDCEFTLAGQVGAGGTIPLHLLTAGADQSAQLRLVDASTISFSTSSLPAACGSTFDAAATASGVSLAQHANISSSVIAFRTIKAQKALFLDAAGGQATGKFVVAGQTVRQLSENDGGFVEVSFSSPQGANTRGFMAETDLAPLGFDSGL